MLSVEDEASTQLLTITSIMMSLYDHILDCIKISHVIIVIKHTKTPVLKSMTEMHWYFDIRYTDNV